MYLSVNLDDVTHGSSMVHSDFVADPVDEVVPLRSSRLENTWWWR